MMEFKRTIWVGVVAIVGPAIALRICPAAERPATGPTTQDAGDVVIIEEVVVPMPIPLLGEIKKPQDVTAGEFMLGYLDPRQLQFSCNVMGDQTEDALGKQLVDPNADPADRIAAAKALWRGRSRRRAADVLMFLAGDPVGNEEFRQLQRQVNDETQPKAILGSLKDQYLWGTWLAFLRPSKELVPALLAGLKEKPDALPETMLALGNSGDNRALRPLLDLLKSNDYRTMGDAADALGYLGNPAAEGPLIEALAGGDKSPWRQVNACTALGRLGTARALPELQRLADDPSYTGALSVRGSAARAIERIKKREKP